MRFNEVVCNSMSPMHIQLLHNNNQLVQRSSSDLMINEKAADKPTDLTTQPQQFHIGQDTGIYSSLAITRSNKVLERNINNNNNNNLGNTFPSSSTESLADFQEDEQQEEGGGEEEEEAGSDWSEYSEDANLPAGCRGIVNPNYPGFQHLGPSLLSDTDDTDDEHELDDQLAPLHDDVFNNNNNNNHSNHSLICSSSIGFGGGQLDKAKNNNNDDDALNRLDVQTNQHKQFFYEKPKFNIQTASTLMECMSYVKGVHDTLASKISDEDVEIVQLSTSVNESLQFAQIERIAADSCKSSETDEVEESSTLEEPLDLIREASFGHNNNNNNDNNKNNNNNSSHSNEPSRLFCNSKNNNNTKLIDYSPTISTNPFLNNPFLEPLSAKVPLLDEIDLLADCRQLHQSIGDGDNKQRQQLQPDPVPDVVAMDHEHLKCSQPMLAPRKQQQQQHNSLRDQRGRCFKDNNQQQQQQQKRKVELETDCFDVYNIETAMPKIDMDAIEMHLKAARAEERRRRNDREEIRRRLAMGPEAQAEEARSSEQRRANNKPSLQSRLQSGMNLQICFMNESISDSESQLDRLEFDELEKVQQQDKQLARSRSTSSSCCSTSSASSSSLSSGPSSPRRHPLSVSACEEAAAAERLLLTAKPRPQPDEAALGADPVARQARLQTEARLALAQAKEMAHMQMEIERQKLKVSPITEMVRTSLQKIGVSLGEDRRRLTRALLTELNIAQLQVLANDLHARIATLNEALVDGLLMRDDLHMEQDSMLVDVEDLTRYLGAKQESFKKQQQKQQQQHKQPRDAIAAATTGKGSSARKAALARAQLLQRSQATTRTTLALLKGASQGKLASQGRQLVANLVRK